MCICCSLTAAGTVSMVAEALLAENFTDGMQLQTLMPGFNLTVARKEEP